MKESDMIKVADAISKEEERIMRIEYEMEKHTYIMALKKKYRSIDVYGDVAIVEDSHYKQGVVSLDGTIIVPVNKYGWIDVFDSGFARVRTHGRVGYINPKRKVLESFKVDNNGELKNVPYDVEAKQERLYEDSKLHPEKYAKWGIINTRGEEVLPLEYDEIWSWKGKHRTSTTVRKGDELITIRFDAL